MIENNWGLQKLNVKDKMNMENGEGKKEQEKYNKEKRKRIKKKVITNHKI